MPNSAITDTDHQILPKPQKYPKAAQLVRLHCHIRDAPRLPPRGDNQEVPQWGTTMQSGSPPRGITKPNTQIAPQRDHHATRQPPERDHHKSSPRQSPEGDHHAAAPRGAPLRYTHKGTLTFGPLAHAIRKLTLRIHHTTPRADRRNPGRPTWADRRNPPGRPTWADTRNGRPSAPECSELRDGRPSAPVSRNNCVGRLLRPSENLLFS